MSNLSSRGKPTGGASRQPIGRGALDQLLLGPMLALLVCGLLLALSTTFDLADRNGQGAHHYIVRQSVYALLALGAALAIAAADERQIRRAGIVWFFAVTLSLPLLWVVGSDFGKGATRWISLGFLAVQPSEFVKSGLAVFSAWMLWGATEKGGPPGVGLSFLAAVAVAALLVLQPDFGQAALVIGIWAVMYCLAGASIPALLSLVGVGAAAGGLAISLSDHARGRIAQFLAGESPRFSQGDQVSDAIRNAGWFGEGVNDGRVTPYLAEAHSDFIIAAAADEFGWAFCMLVLFCYLAIGLRVAWIIPSMRSTFAQLLAAGVTAQLLLQALIHFGVNTQILPNKGMALPFVSYGGSSMLAAGVAMGILLSLSRSRAMQTTPTRPGKAGCAPVRGHA